MRIIADRNSRRSKGIAYVEFVAIQSVPLAIGLTGQRLLGVPIMVQASQVGIVNFSQICFVFCPFLVPYVLCRTEEKQKFLIFDLQSLRLCRLWLHYLSVHWSGS